MPTPREELNRLRSLAAQDVLVTQSAPPETSRQELDRLRNLAKQEALVAQGTEPKVALPTEVIKDEVGIGTLEPALTVASSVVAEPVSGLAGILASAAPVGAVSPFGQAFADEPGIEVAGLDIGAETIKNVRDSLTYQPKTEEGKKALQVVGKTLEPVAKVLKAVDFSQEVFDLTGSPLAASIFATLPTAALEIAGLKGTAGLTKLRQAARAEKEVVKSAKKAIIDNAPDVEKLNNASQALYKKLSDSGVKIKVKEYDKFADTLTQTLIKKGVDKDLTKKAFIALEKINASKGVIKSFDDIDKLREFAKNAAGTLDPSDSRLGNTIISELDDLLGDPGNKVFDFNPKVGKISTFSGIEKQVKIKEFKNTVKAARDLYGRSKKSQLVNEAVENALLSPSGIEAGLKNEFTKLLRSKKNKRFLKPHEIKALESVAIRPVARNIIRSFAKLGFSEGNVLGILSGGGAAAFGGSKGLAIPIVGEVAKFFLNKATKNATQQAQNAIAVGKDANKIIKNYMRAVPKAKRSADDLSELLLSIDVGSARGIIIDKAGITGEAIELVKGKKVLRLLEAVALTGPGIKEAIKTPESKKGIPGTIDLRVE